jgi:SAM-dependent methyltransferase
MNDAASARATVRHRERASAMSLLKSRLRHYPMKNALFAGDRTALLAATQGRVLEISFDIDKNLPYYSPWVTSLTIICLQGAPADSRQDASDHGMPIERIFPGDETAPLPFEDASFDWVVTTLTLCRAQHPEALLAEIRRVLKPSGSYLFLEHGRSPDPAMRRWQSRLRNLWMQIGGCDVNREIDTMIGAAGLHPSKLDRYQLGWPKFLSTMVRGLARCAENTPSRSRSSSRCIGEDLAKT